MSRRIHSIDALVIVTLLLLFALVPVVSAAPRTAETKTVDMMNFKFNPQTITVNVGDSITWKNGDNVEHTATADDGSFNTDDVGAGQAKTITFSKAGTFAYYCKYHGGPGGKGMSGTITVQEAAAAPAQSTPAPTQSAAAPAQPATATGSLEVSDQPVVNNSITIAKATTSADSWIVIHKAGPDGKLLLTPVIGMTQIKAGDTANVVIKLTEAVAPNAPLWPMIHIDAGEKGKYEFPNGPDVPATGDKATVQIKVLASGSGGPGQLPRTGGEDAPTLPLALGVVVFLIGTLLALRARRRSV